MPVISDFSFVQQEDAILTVSLSPPLAVGGLDIQTVVTRRFGGSIPLITKSMASGFYGFASGMAIVNSGQGIFQVKFNSLDTSGLPSETYAYSVDRLDPGARTQLAAGYLLLGIDAQG